MPKPVDHTWPAGMVMPVPVAVAVPVDVTGRARLRMAHDAQDARRTGLQHIDNKPPESDCETLADTLCGLHAR